jgi:hypothetical protein
MQKIKKARSPSLIEITVVGQEFVQTHAKV